MDDGLEVDALEFGPCDEIRSVDDVIAQNVTPLTRTSECLQSYVREF